MIKDVDTDGMKLLFDERNIREVITLWNQKENRCTQKFDFAKCFYIFSHNGVNGLTLRRIKARKKIFDVDLEQSVLLHCNAQFRVRGHFYTQGMHTSTSSTCKEMHRKFLQKGPQK